MKPSTSAANSDWPSYGDATRQAGGAAASATHRARLGVIIPSVNTVVEPWFSATIPRDVSLHATRMLLAAEVSVESLRHMDREEGVAAALRVASCRPDAIAYCCTASSIVQGLGYDAHLAHALAQETGRKCFTAAGAIIDALRTLAARTISIASPYVDAIDKTEHEFFEKAGFRVRGTANLDIADGFALAAPTPVDIYELARRAWDPDADVLVISCLNMNSQTVVEVLERTIRRPVVTSTTATLWKLLRTAGLDDQITGYGRLLGER